MAFLATVYRKTLGSVVFGISLMVLLAAYIAVGSGLASLREWLEMNEMQFFRAWPILVLSILLMLNLICVTVERIPLTPPRYGVWTIHMGVIVLVMGMIFYFMLKQEGLAIVFQGRPTSHYYDSFERSLFMRLATPSGTYRVDPRELGSLPRFKTYLTDSKEMAGRDLHGIVPTMRWPNSQTGALEAVPLAQQFKLDDDLRLDVLAYYPFATISSGPVQTGDKNVTSIELSIRDPHAAEGHPHTDGAEHDGHTHDQAVMTRWISADEPSRRMTPLALGVAEHRVVDDAEIDKIIAAAHAIHRLEVKIGDVAQTISDVEVGQTYPIGDSGYTIKVESYQPDWVTIDQKRVPAMTLLVTAPQQSFRRMVLADRAEPTDFKLGEGAGPMGQRQTKPLDDQLQITYSFNDEYHLAGREQGLWLILTSPQRTALVAIPAQGKVEELQSTDGKLQYMLGGNVGLPMPVTIVRHDGTQLVDQVTEIPANQRRRDELGFNQVVLVQVSMGEWSRQVLVPYAQWALDTSWQGGFVPLADTGLILQLQLGNTVLPMPARVVLDRFELVNYMGGTPQTTNLFRDFKSHLTLIDPQSGQKRQAVAHMNNPIYFGGLGDSYWTLFQAQWDPDGQRFTVLGVGNRPGVWVMTLGCVMITVGLLWAFYLKPVLIRRMKQKALAKAMASGRLAPGKIRQQNQPQDEPVASA
ncbi:MAG: hypothetical protein IT448_07370 [Phycisphaerales bacterium]|nr:hypothetical protein [Phycisphaerales bacterium]